MLEGKKRAVVLLSGGLDSATTLAAAKSEMFELFALSIDYRQRHNIELQSAKAIASALAVAKHLIVNIDLREIGGSALTSPLDVPKNVSSSGGIPVTYVPARNTIFLSFALAWAEVLQAEDIFIGANAVDYSGYPDCRPGYLRAFEEMANLATKAAVENRFKIRIRAPLLYMKKSEIILHGTALGLDYSLTWSCYDPQPVGCLPGDRRKGSKFMPCGSCESCRLRQKGFREAGIADPLQTLYDNNRH